MIKKLFAAALVVAAAAATTAPAPAIDFICSCDLCQAHPSLACWDLDRSPVVRTSCGTYYSNRCG
jgi:hypothetical protein